MASAATSKKTGHTRERIVAAAEKLFAEKGFRAMTLRDVTHEAGVNLAAVNYHFGSKRDLMRAVIRSHFEPINTARIERLDALVAEHQPHSIPLEAIFYALFSPLFEFATLKDGTIHHSLIQLIGRSITEPAAFVRTMHNEFFLEPSRLFIQQLHRTCSDLPEEEIQYRFFFATSTLIGTIVKQSRLEMISENKLSGQDTEPLLKHLVAFTVSGFRQGNA
ncbi:MAG: TetR/AcrR family transcriptional regulator, partial [Opitutales bacterium]